jgi:hypothetical protein
MLDPEIDWTMLLENDLATLVREISSRYRVDRRSLLPLVPRRDAGAPMPPAAWHLKTDVVILQRR